MRIIKAKNKEKEPKKMTVKKRGTEQHQMGTSPPL